ADDAGAAGALDDRVLHDEACRTVREDAVVAPGHGQAVYGHAAAGDADGVERGVGPADLRSRRGGRELDVAAVDGHAFAAGTPDENRQRLAIVAARKRAGDGVAGGAIYGDGPVLAAVPLPVAVGIGESGGVKRGERDRGDDAG